MAKTLGTAISVGALALALGWAASPVLAWGSTHPAGVAQAKLLKPDPPPVIRGSAARLDHGPVLPPDPW